MPTGRWWPVMLLLDLQVEADDLGAGDDTDYEVLVTDAYGNEVDVEVFRL